MDLHWEHGLDSALSLSERGLKARGRGTHRGRAACDGH